MIRLYSNSIMKEEPGLAHFAILYPSDTPYHRFSIDLPTSVLSASEKRITEHVAGRFCAHEALSRISEEPVNKTQWLIPSADDRSPIWPKGIVGSITHSDDFAWASVGKSRLWRSIGIDSELILSQSTFEEIRDLVATPTELSQITSNCDPMQALTLIFSAKESIYKCLYPLVSHFFDFLDVSIVHFDFKQGVFEGKLLKNLSSEFQSETTLTGEFEITPLRVFTSLKIRA